MRCEACMSQMPCGLDLEEATRSPASLPFGVFFFLRFFSFACFLSLSLLWFLVIPSLIDFPHDTVQVSQEPPTRKRKPRGQREKQPYQHPVLASHKA